MKKELKKMKKKDDITSVFASADEFAELLDEEPDFMAGSSQAMSNKDNASMLKKLILGGIFVYGLFCR